MQAVILCGGKGTRLASLYSDRPKILVPIAGRPFIEWQFEWLGRQGITDIHLAGGYKAEVLQQWLEERSQKSEVGSQKSEVRSRKSEVRGRKSEVRGRKSEVRGQKIEIQGCKIQDPASSSASHLTSHISRFTLHLSPFTFSVSLSTEPVPLGTGGGLKYVSPWLSGDSFLAINGDSITPNLDIQGLMVSRRDTGAALTIAVSQINEAGRYGTVEFDGGGRITAFQEKANRSNGWINTGVYLIGKKILDAIPADRPVSLETEIFPLLVRQGRLFATPCSSPMLDMGTPEGIAAMEDWIKSGANASKDTAGGRFTTD